VKLSRRQFTQLSLAAAGALAAPAILRTTAVYADDRGRARNVILLISDGAGFHTWTATSYFQHGGLGRQVFDSFPVRTLMTTYPLNTSREPTGGLVAQVGYDAAAAWNTKPMPGTVNGRGGKFTYVHGFNGYDFVRQNSTDSAAAGTALSAGQKTYNSAINWSNDDRPLRMIGDRVRSTGRALGVVSSVQVSHATPAAFICHNRSRSDYVGIGQEMLETGLADLVMGAGHPMFNDDGAYATPVDDTAFRFVGGANAYTKLVTGQTDYHFLDAKSDFGALAEGTLKLRRDKIYGLAPAANTLQYARSGGAKMGGFLSTVPSLETMTRGALNWLGKKENGFFLMVEGGAVDWACHANSVGRMLEEQIDFNRSVEAVVKWVEANGGWDTTLVIVTTDHGNGIIYGPESERFAFHPVVNRGAGNLPEVKWHSDQHTNELVPVWAKGPSSDLLNQFSTGKDANTGLVGWGDQRRYHDNTDIARVLETAMTAAG
jgi:alkaline phosphatase